MSILDRIVADKQEEVAWAAGRIPEAALRAQIADTPWTARGFARRLSRPGPGGVNIIAEIKRASPSKGDICPDLDAAQCARQYAAGGAAALSVLTDGPYFKGSLEDQRRARGAVTLPVLRKEFIVSAYQLYESRAAGADAVLLIVRILTAVQLKEWLVLCGELGMDALVEIHTPEEYAAAHAAGARLIGINNRNLATLTPTCGPPCRWPPCWGRTRCRWRPAASAAARTSSATWPVASSIFWWVKAWCGPRIAGRF